MAWTIPRPARPPARSQRSSPGACITSYGIGHRLAEVVQLVGAFENIVIAELVDYEP